jgi:hypothetical protein
LTSENPITAAVVSSFFSSKGNATMSHARSGVTLARQNRATKIGAVAKWITWVEILHQVERFRVYVSNMWLTCAQLRDIMQYFPPHRENSRSSRVCIVIFAFSRLIDLNNFSEVLTNAFIVLFVVGGCRLL